MTIYTKVNIRKYAKSKSHWGAHNFSHPAVATYENPWTAARYSELFFDLVADGELNVNQMIIHRVNYHKAPEIYYKILKDCSAYMGIVIDWEAN